MRHNHERRRFVAVAGQGQVTVNLEAIAGFELNRLRLRHLVGLYPRRGIEQVFHVPGLRVEQPVLTGFRIAGHVYQQQPVVVRGTDNPDPQAAKRFPQCRIPL